MSDRKKVAYVCRNKEDWQKLMHFLNTDKRHRWVGDDAVFSSNGEMSVGYMKDVIEVVFVDESYYLRHSDLSWALEHTEGMGYTLYWVHKEAFFIGSSFLLKPNLPHL